MRGRFAPGLWSQHQANEKKRVHEAWHISNEGQQKERNQRMRQVAKVVEPWEGHPDAEEHPGNAKNEGNEVTSTHFASMLAPKISALRRRCTFETLNVRQLMRTLFDAAPCVRTIE